MDHTDCLRIVAVVEANHRLCEKIIAKICIPSALNGEAAVIKTLITDLKDSLTSKFEALEERHEDSEEQATIYTLSNSGNFPILNLNVDLRNNT